MFTLTSTLSSVLLFPLFSSASSNPFPTFASPSLSPSCQFPVHDYYRLFEALLPTFVVAAVYHSFSFALDYECEIEADKLELGLVSEPATKLEPTLVHLLASVLANLPGLVVFELSVSDHEVAPTLELLLVSALAHAL